MEPWSAKGARSKLEAGCLTHLRIYEIYIKKMIFFVFIWLCERLQVRPSMACHVGQSGHVLNNLAATLRGGVWMFSSFQGSSTPSSAKELGIGPSCSPVVGNELTGPNDFALANADGIGHCTFMKAFMLAVPFDPESSDTHLIPGRC